jgi:hypothetical protein
VTIVERIHPVMAQLYTLDRAAPNTGLLPATAEQLHAVYERVDAGGIPAAVHER